MMWTELEAKYMSSGYFAANGPCVASGWVAGNEAMSYANTKENIGIYRTQEEGDAASVTKWVKTKTD